MLMDDNATYRPLTAWQDSPPSVNTTPLLAGNRPAASSPHSGSAVLQAQRPDSWRLPANNPENGRQMTWMQVLGVI